MAIQLKPIKDQIMVITGASSGIGLATAEEAAKRGAKLALAARSGNALSEIAGKIQRAGGEAIAVVCDVADRSQVQELARRTFETYGRIDTWVNNAGISIYGRIHVVSEEDGRRLFDTNFWGVYHGSLVALPYLLQSGGALINVGSEVSEAVVPLQGLYSASKHAVKGFTDALRVEIEEIDKSQISITLIQPTAVDTPFPQHAKNYMDQEPKLPTPMIDASQVAKAILDAAEKPTRSAKVGLMAKVNTTISKVLPGLGDKLAAKQATRQQYDERPRNPDGALHRPSEETSVVARTSGTGGKEIE